MTLDNVFQWSQEAGVASGSEPVNITALQRFAALVAAAEREACAVVCERLPETFKIAADEFGYEAETPTAENYAAAIRTRIDE